MVKKRVKDGYKLNKKILREIKTEERQLRSLEVEEKKIESLEEKQLAEIEELKNIEISIREKVGEHPLRKITYKDVGKSIIGAFVGIVSHFTAFEGVHIAENISGVKSISLLFISLMVGFIMLYYTGFRKLKDPRLLVFLPLRLFLVYAVTLLVIILVLYMFGIAHQEVLFKQIAVLSLPAMIGACAADLIGGD